MSVIITHKEDTGNIVFTMDPEAAGELVYALVVAKVQSDTELKTFENYPEIVQGVKAQNEKFNCLLNLLWQELGL